MTGAEHVRVEIRDDHIRLGQLLQLAGLVDSGSEAKAVLAEGEVLVNGEPDDRRGRKVRPGDRVEAYGNVIEVAAAG